jgi:hypothetical protein
MAIKGAFKAPEVHNIRFEDTTVVVRAKDEFRVAAVEVRVSDSTGRIRKGQSRIGAQWGGLVL